MPSVVQFGAGAIGRGLLGQLWQEAGYETVFVDTDVALVDALNAQRSYTLKLVDNQSEQALTINNFHALHASDTKAIAQAITTCDFAASAVGYDNLTAVGPVLAQGLRRRRKSQPCLNVLVCENGLLADLQLSMATLNALPLSVTTVNHYHHERVRFISTVVDRMVPPARPGDLTLITEPHGRLSYPDRWQGPTPPPSTLFPFHFFDGHHVADQKLYLHNGGHFLIACLGLERGYTTIDQAAADPQILHELRGFWDEVNAGIQSESQVELPDITPSLLHRFQNKAIADTCARVARNPGRKLEPNERLRGAKRLCEKHGIETPFINRAIAAAEALLPSSAVPY
ncbi:hypothetical protein [Armatimonas sp.]|uniref:mannitol dehydrogenase family protein n=1 Tax=Armatimonas sp. TaxID=1872638 RepID=UPI00374CAF19